MADLRLIAESHGGFQSPLNEQMIIDLGRKIGLGPRQVVLDAGAGSGGPAVLLAKQVGCRVIAVESSEALVALGVERARSEGVGDLINYVCCDLADFELEPEMYDAALCLGAAWILGGFAKTAQALGDAVRVGGHVGVGDLAAATGAGDDHEALSMRRMLEVFLELGLMPVTMAQSSLADWDGYHSRMMLAVEDWIDANPDDPDIELVRGSRIDAINGALAQRELPWVLVAGRRRRSVQPSA
jgi:SAM-dependent methyltransferase